MALPSPTDLEWSPISLAALAVTGVVWVRLLAPKPAAPPLLVQPDGDAPAQRRPSGGHHAPAADAAATERHASLAGNAGAGNAGVAPQDRRRRAAFAATGLALLAVALVSPLATLAGHYLLTAHLLQVTLVMGFAPPLLLLALPRTLPTVPRPLRIAGRIAVHPGCAIVMVNLVFFGVHAPVLYDAALREPLLYALQQLLLFLVSLAFWWAIVEPTGPGSWSMGGLVKLGYILLATIPQTFAGLLFALAHHVFYAPYAAAPRVTGLDALGDQQLAGALMAILSKLALFAAFSVILWRVLDAEEQEGEPGDDGWRDGGDGERPQPVPPDSPAWLELLHRGRTVPEPSPAVAHLRAPSPREAAGSAGER